MAEVKKLAPFILKWEGGFVNDPDDLGGATNKGVTIATYEAYCRKKGYPKPTIERLKALTKEEWTEIIKTMYWDRWKADEIKSQSVANILVDWVWAWYQDTAGSSRCTARRHCRTEDHCCSKLP